MSFAGSVKRLVNGVLRPLNMRVESLAAERAETARLSALEAAGQFESSILPLLESFRRCEPEALLQAVLRYSPETGKFAEAGRENGYCFANDYFTSPDAEVAYAIVRDRKPRRLVEIGSGNSTWLFRAAIGDGGLETQLVSVDPSPRREVAAVADRVIRQRLQEIDELELVDNLDDGDVLFIDSSHTIESGSDVVVLLLRVLPALRPGVLVHLHDIFLPFEYPRKWLVELGWKWNEQYLVQALLQDSTAFEVLWPGHYLQRTIPGFANHFRADVLGTGSSLWLRKVGPRSDAE